MIILTKQTVLQLINIRQSNSRQIRVYNVYIISFCLDNRIHIYSLYDQIIFFKSNNFCVERVGSEIFEVSQHYEPLAVFLFVLF